MIILGIDPGTARAGYGVISVEGGKTQLITAGIIKVSRTKDKAGTLEEIRAGVQQLYKEHHPAMMAIEKLYFAKNRTTAIAVAEARGVILVTARSAGLDIREYSPTEIKANITGYGGADKKAVLKMVKIILKAPDLKLIDDASDALALAIVAAQGLRLHSHA